MGLRDPVGAHTTSKSQEFCGLYDTSAKTLLIPILHEVANTTHNERWGAGVEYHFQEI